MTSKRMEQLNRKTLIQQAIIKGLEYKDIGKAFGVSRWYIGLVARNMGVFKGRK